MAEPGSESLPQKTLLKRGFRWLILGAVLFFLLTTLKNHWQEVSQVRIAAKGWAALAIASGITLFAHIFAGYVWTWILRNLGQSATGAWGTKVYLKTNVAKYLPGNIWHFYGRVNAAKQAGIPIDIGILSVVLESLLMLAAACLLASFGQVGWLQGAIAVLILGGVHPRVLNPVLRKVSQSKSNMKLSSGLVDRYPLIALIGELGFLTIRAVGFGVTFFAILPISKDQIPIIVGGFAWSWLLGFVMPGLPGGVGVFEATAIALLGGTFSPGQVLSVVAVYRLVNTIAEALGAGLAALDDASPSLPSDRTSA